MPKAKKAKATSTTIFVNGRSHKVPNRFVTYEQVKELAYRGALPSEVLVTMTYRNGPRENVKGMMVPHEAINVAPSMAFTATLTTRS